jgi:hypothetical protein
MNFCPGSKNSIIGKTARYDRIINELCHLTMMNTLLSHLSNIYVLLKKNELRKLITSKIPERP